MELQHRPCSFPCSAIHACWYVCLHEFNGRLYLTLDPETVAVKHDNFKTCDQSGFCKRNRDYADQATQLSSSWRAPYNLDPQTLKLSNGQLTGAILKDLPNGEQVRLPLTVTFLDSGVARVTLDEEKRQKGDITLRHDSKARKQRYNEAEKWVLVGGLDVNKGAALDAETEAGTTRVHYGPSGTFEAIFTHSPFSVDFRRDGATQVKFNDRGFLNMEHWRPKVEKPATEETSEGEEKKEEAAPEQSEDESTWWEESFGGNTDSKPRGPESVALDITFPGYENVYGIASHAGPLSLKETRYVLASYSDSGPD